MKILRILRIVLFLFIVVSCVRSVATQQQMCADAPQMHLFGVQNLSPQTKQELALRGVTITSGRASFNHTHFDEEREPGAYLRFIISELESGRCLARHYAFVHSHDFAWHQTYNTSLVSLVDTALFALRRFDPKAHSVCENGAFLYLTDLFSRFPFGASYVRGMAARVFPRQLHQGGVNFCSIVPCCAQFIVSREHLAAIDIDVYRHMLTYQTENRFVVGEAHWVSDAGRRANAFEYLWPMLYTELLTQQCANDQPAVLWRTLVHTQSSVVGDARCFAGVVALNESEMKVVQNHPM